MYTCTYPTLPAPETQFPIRPLFSAKWMSFGPISTRNCMYLTDGWVVL